MLAVVVFVAAGAFALYTSSSAVLADARNPRFHHNGNLSPETPPNAAALPKAQGAPTGFDGVTNGYIDQATFDGNSQAFGEVEEEANGLGPTYNAQSCRECHQNVVVGGASQVAELRTGRTVNGQFYESLGGSLIQARATDPSIVEQVATTDNTRTFRISTNTLGAGFIEAIANSTLQAIRDAQPASMRGVALLVPVLEGDGSARIGRFGWKSQHGSLLSFSADAYLNEIGITSPLLPDGN